MWGWFVCKRQIRRNSRRLPALATHTHTHTHTQLKCLCVSKLSRIHHKNIINMSKYSENNQTSSNKLLTQIMSGGFGVCWRDLTVTFPTMCVCVCVCSCLEADIWVPCWWFWSSGQLKCACWEDVTFPQFLSSQRRNYRLNIWNSMTLQTISGCRWF